MTEARVYDVDIGHDPDDTCVVAMIAVAPLRFRPTLVLTNDETETPGRARFLAAILTDEATPIAAGRPSLKRRRTASSSKRGSFPRTFATSRATA